MERLANVESNKYDKVSREFVEEVEQDGVIYEKYRQLVTKNDGDLQGYAEILVPRDYEEVLKLPDEEQQDLLNSMKRQLITKEANRFRTQHLVSEEEKEEQAQKKLEDLKKMGLSHDEILEMIG